ncbi:MAG TPA: class I SAM-dependent methyltransferase [Propionibacteriaceae bacterium]|nr:class I SAM-dependent methyltransferase [Propionibacteriaceae bacterium]
MNLLLTDEGAEALALAAREADPDSLGAASRLRAHFSPEMAAAALTQVALRRRGRTKFGESASTLFLTSHGLEQASRPSVADWRAQRLKASGVTRVVDLGCGIGADALAFQRAGLEVVAVELDPATAEFASANLGIDVIVGDAEVVAGDLLAGAGSETVANCDPARRNDQGRLWRPEQFTPSWGFVGSLLAGPTSAVVKLGPGVPKQLLPGGVRTSWVSDRGAVVEASLWRVPDLTPGREAVLLPGGDCLELPDHPRVLHVGPVGRFLLEPDGAVIRSGTLAEIDPDAWLVAPGIAYLTSDVPIESPFATTFEVLDVLDYSERTLRAWVRDGQVGSLEIKKRGVEVDPAELRKRLKPKGPGAATLVLTPTTLGVRALVVRRTTVG